LLFQNGAWALLDCIFDEAMRTLIPFPVFVYNEVAVLNERWNSIDAMDYYNQGADLVDEGDYDAAINIPRPEGRGC
jgi:hypothetical protein